ncbi:MAG: NB-ARC domain-containing protein [Rhizonema sp. PD38]|nr:NB-ARC domain-containing protein [Rhizonema sp. PD38]
MSQLPDSFITEVATRYGVTKTERDTLLMALKNCSGAEIAAKLNISQAAVRKRLGESYRKFGIEGNGNKKLNNLRQTLLSQYQKNSVISPTRCEDWGEAGDADGFWGREEEISDLEQWIVDDAPHRCKLVTVLGMGGIGKTVLASQVAKKVREDFDYLFWRSLHTLPSLSEILTQLLHFLLQDAELKLPDNDNGKILRLIDVLKTKRCLVIFDKVEAVLRSGNGKTYEWAGEYKPGYEKYGYLFKKVAEAAHDSCLLLTSREKPKQVALLEGKNLPVKVLHLKGLNNEEAWAMLQDKGFSCSDAQLSELVERYSGNPLALKMVATTVYDLFSNNTSEFLNQIHLETAVYGDFRTILVQQFDRLSNLEKELMYWLAIHRNYVSLTELKDNLIAPQPVTRVLEAVESLLRRSLIEKEADSGRFRSLSVVMEYVTEQLIEQAYEEIRLGEKLEFINSYSLIRARSLSYLRKTQQQLILEPIAKKLLSVFGKELEPKLRRMLASLRTQSPPQKGYTAGNLINLSRQLQFTLSGRDFSDLTIQQADLEDVNLQNTSLENTDLTSSVFTETMSSLMAVRFSPNGKFFATGLINGEIRLWRTSDIRQIHIYKGHNGWVWAFAFSLDSKILASGSADSTVKLWDVETGECLRTLREHTNKVHSVALHPHGEILASASEDRTIKLWDINTGICLKTLNDHTNSVLTVTFRPIPPNLPDYEDSILASSSVDGTIKLWHVNTGKCLKTLTQHNGSVHSAHFSPDGRTLASGSEDHTVKLWDISSGECIKTFRGHSKKVYSVRFRSDGRTLASSGEDRIIKLWNVETGECLRNLLGHESQVWAIAFSPDGTKLISGSDDQTARLWDVATGKCLNVLRGYTRDIYSVAFSSNNQILASGSDDHKIGLWDLRTSKCHSLVGHVGRIRSVAFSPDGKIIASGSADNTIKLWDIRDIGNSKCIHTLEGHTNWVWTVVFSPDGKTLASCSEDRTVRIWDLQTKECLKILTGHNYWVTTVAFCLNGKILASGSTDSTVKLWNLDTEQCITTLTDHTNIVWSVAFSSDGKTLASSSEDQTARLWNINTGECLQVLDGHSKQVYSVAFSPDGQILATGSGDATIKLWSVNTGNFLDHLTSGHTAAIRSVAFSSDGQLLASGSEDESIQLWDIQKCRRLQQLKSDRLYEGMKITGISGLTDAEKASLKALGAVEKGDCLPV